MKKYFEKYRKAAALAAVFLLVALALAFRNDFWTKPAASPAPPDDAAVEDAAASQPPGIVRTGTVEPPYAVAIKSGVTGRISAMYVAEGQAVKAGQPLFRVEGTPGTGEAPAGTVNKKAGPSVSRQESYENAQKDYNRLQKLYELGAIPRRQFENAAARLEEARRNLDSDSEESEQSEKPATASGPVVITAPVDGTVTAFAAGPGQTVQADQQVLALGGGQKVAIVVPLEQQELYLVHLGTMASVEAAGNVLTGRVSSIFPDVQDNNVVSFRAQITLSDPPDGLLKAGMSVNVRIDPET